MSTPLVEPSPANSPVMSRKGFAQEPSFKFGPEDFLKLSVEINKSDRYEQISDVKNILIKDNLIHPTRIDPEVDWFYMKLGIERDYFDSTPAHVIAKHILALYSAKMVSHATNNRLEVQLHNHAEGGAIFIVPSVPGVRDSPAMAVEQMIEEHFLGDPSSNPTDITKVTKSLSISQTTLPPTMPPHGFRLACYRTAGSVSPSSDTRLRMYFLSTPIYPTDTPAVGETNLQQVSDIQFWARSSDNTKKIYQEVMTEVLKSIGPVIRAFPSESEKGSRLVIGFKRGSTHSYWSSLSDLYHYYGMYTTHKYVEQLSNDVVICSMYLAFMEHGVFLENGVPKTALAIQTLSEQASLCYVMPRTSLTSLYTNGPLSAEEVTYAYVLWKFSYQFLNRFAVEYDAIAQALRKDVKAKNMLATMKSRLMKDTFTESRVREAIMLYPALIKDLYKDFVHYHCKKPGKPTPAYDRTHGNDIFNNINKQTTTELDAQVFTACLTFNRHVLKTNYFKATKVALSFRLDPAFIDTRGYAEVPFGVFFVVGSEFRGFHIRFRDIARGGIRIIKSANKTTYDQNSASLFEENYNLAYTQQQKNKDIPEGGSKGTILLTTDHQNKAEVAFHKYIDALLDVLLPTEEIVDYYNKEEILFLGPDEGTADYMDWASQHARLRKYPFWKAFTTGKSPSIGGIPHDLHGMTTRSIHQYVLGTLSKLGLSEKDCSKFQTGGPDGDLGSNEIKISEDKTVGIVDGSGVLYDPSGLDRTELLRLATARVMSKDYSKDKLSPQGFFVSITDVDVTLPNGTPVGSGMAFRNNFHLNSLVNTDIFVPCGGRPESVQMNNVDQLLNKDGTPRFKIVVEGANLFFTQNARLILEEKGVIIFKDASANKGGVTSSSMEVFSALALNDEEFAEKMMVKGEIPAFHKAYIADVHHKIETNARQEFECIWREHEKTKTPRCVLSDELSKKINNLNDQIQTSPLWDDLKLRNKVLSEACPKTLLDSIGLDKIVQRVPETYMRAIFGASLASRFVYECGIHSPEFAFFTFVQKYLKD